MHLTPAEVVIRAFGGVRATARAIGRSPTQVSKWQKPKDVGGTGGSVPVKAQKVIFEYAKTNNLDLTAEDLIVGRSLDHLGESQDEQI